MQPLIEPNWHIALVHFPIALIVFGTLVELFSFLGWRGSGFRRAGRWMFLIGAVTAVPTTFNGLYALHYVAPEGLNELAQSKPLLAQTMTQHVITQSVATAGSMFVVVLWLALSPGWRDRLNLLFKLMLIGISGLILYGSHLGGESVYYHGLGVDTRRAPTSLPSLEQAKHIKTWEDLAPPEQSHVTMAGLAVAIACVTLGLAIRTASSEEDPSLSPDHADRIAAAFAPDALSDPTLPPVHTQSRNYTPPFPVARFWFLAALLLIMTATLGDWIVAQSVGWDVKEIWKAISHPVEDNGPAVTRRLAHFIVGGTLIVDTLLLGLIARFAPRRSVLLLVFAVPLVLALVAQLWLGILLLFDGPAGAVTGFQP